MPKRRLPNLTMTNMFPFACRNQEVQRACEELLDMIVNWPRENTDRKLSSEDCNSFRQHCSQQMYQVRHVPECTAAEPENVHP